MTFRRQQLAMIVGGNLLKMAIVVACAGLVVWYTGTRITSLGENVLRTRLLASKVEKQAQTAAILRAELANVDDKDKRVDEALLKPENILDFLAFLESAASQNSMKQRVRFATPIPVSDGNIMPGVESLEFTIELTGTMQTLVNYLKTLEKAPYFVGQNSISLSSMTENGWNGDSNISLTGTIYVHE